MVIAVRELKDKLSECLRRVQAGEQLTITAHGRPVATLSPVDFANGSPAQRLALLEARGDVSVPRKGRFEPVKRSCVRGRPVSESLLEDRG